MARLLLMSDLVLRCQRRADMENSGLASGSGSGVVAPAEWKALISEQYAQLYSTVVKAGMRYFEATATIMPTGALSYPVPTDHDETIGIDRVIDATSGRRVQLGELMIQERNRLLGLVGDARGYSIVGQTVALYPAPTTGTYVHLYVPQAPDLSTAADSALVDLVTGDGEAFLIYGVAVKALHKTESDTNLAIAERDAAARRFAEDVQMRALSNPRRRIVQRDQLGDGWDDGGFMPGDWGWDRY